MASNVSLVLFPGLAADERLLEPQRALPYEIIAPPWIEPQDDDTLPAYARRVAESNSWPERFIVGGVSFGGMLAAELALVRRPAGVILLGSCLNPEAVPTLYRFVHTMSKLIPDAAVRLGASVSRPFVNFFRDIGPEDERVMTDMTHETPIPRLRRCAAMVVNWKGVRELPCPRLWIHGENDLVIPLKKLAPDVPELVIPGAGHLVNWTHRDQTNAAIRRFVESLDQN